MGGGTSGYDRFEWTPERWAFLVDNRGKLSSAQIAARLGTTKGVVTGKAWREKLPKLKDPIVRKYG